MRSLYSPSITFYESKECPSVVRRLALAFVEVNRAAYQSLSSRFAQGPVPAGVDIIFAFDWKDCGKASDPFFDEMDCGHAR